MIRYVAKITGPLNASSFRRMMNWFPPNIGAGIRVSEINKDLTYAKVVMPLKWYNQNYVGTHFGGSLYSMCDPYYVLLLLNALGNEFIVWDKSASIKYIKPGKSTVHAEFFLDDELITSLREMNPSEKKVFDLPVDVKDTNGDLIACVIKTLYVKRKDKSPSPEKPNEQ